MSPFAPGALEIVHARAFIPTKIENLGHICAPQRALLLGHTYTRESLPSPDPPSSVSVSEAQPQRSCALGK
eukprot:scaffold72757_cov60-Phaeocystis_antarctica.AAC.2